MNKFYTVKTGLVTWNTFVHPTSFVQMKLPRFPMELQRENFWISFQLSNPSPIFVHFVSSGSFGWKFEIFLDNSIGIVSSNRKQELQKNIMRRWTGLKIKSLPQIPGESRKLFPRHAILELPFTAKSLSSPRVLARIIHMDRDISLSSRFSRFPPLLFFLIRLKATILITSFSRKYFSLPNLTVIHDAWAKFFHTSGCF